MEHLVDVYRMRWWNFLIRLQGTLKLDARRRHGLQKATCDTDRGSALEFGDIELHEKLAPAHEAGNPKTKLSGVIIRFYNVR